MTDQRETDVPSVSRKSVRRSIVEIVIVAVTSFVFGMMFANSTKAGEYEPFNQGTGVILTGSAVCFNSEINSDVIRLLKTYKEVIDSLDAFERGVGPPLSEEDTLFGSFVEDSDLCSITNYTFQVLILRHSQGHFLVRGGTKDLSFVAAEVDVVVDADGEEL